MTPLEDEAKPQLNSSLRLGSMTHGPLYDLANQRESPTLWEEVYWSEGQKPSATSSLIKATLAPREKAATQMCMVKDIMQPQEREIVPRSRRHPLAGSQSDNNWKKHRLRYIQGKNARTEVS